MALRAQKVSGAFEKRAPGIICVPIWESLMTSTMALHVRYNSLYISLPSSASQQRVVK